MNLQRTPLNLLFRPFTFIAGGPSLVLGLGMIVVSGVIGWFGGAHFDGVLDLHVGGQGPFWLPLAEGLVDWLCLFVILLVAGKLISTTAFRVIDLAGTQALARWPMIFAAAISLPPAVGRFGELLVREALKPRPQIPFLHPDAVIFFAATALIMVCTVWMVALMYQSFSVSCNVRGAKAIWTFVASLVVAEALSKLVLFRLLYHNAVP